MASAVNKSLKNINVFLNGFPSNFIIDAGSDINVMDKNTLKSIKDATLKSVNKSVHAYGHEGSRTQIPVGCIDRVLMWK